MVTAMRLSSSLFWCLITLLGGISWTLFAQASVVRPYNLDYFDVDTMSYYLQQGPATTSTTNKHDYDVAVLYYTQWCSNCHAFAPYWDQMSRMLKAGSQDSKLIMGLFDCEKDAQHVEVCNQANIKHYPTIMFYSLSGQVFSRKNQRKTKRNPYPLPQHGVEFAGNWMYSDSVFDWLRSMSRLSAWHRQGWGRKLRSLLTGGKPQKAKPLPLGIPIPGVDGSVSSSSSSSVNTLVGGEAVDGTGATTSASLSSSSASALMLKQKVKRLEDASEKLQEMAVRGELMLGAVLAPETVQSTSMARVAANQSLVSATLRQDNGRNYTDAFVFLAETDGWTKPSAKSLKTNDDHFLLLQSEDLVLRSCVLELSLDYCTRMTTKVTLDWIDLHGDNLTDEVLANLDADLIQGVEDLEPYCVVLESCIQNDMEPIDPCQPATCPFADVTACRYLTACFDTSIQNDYAKALNLTTTASKLAAERETTLDLVGSTTAEKQQQGGGVWGM